MCFSLSSVFCHRDPSWEHTEVKEKIFLLPYSRHYCYFHRWQPRCSFHHIQNQDESTVLWYTHISRRLWGFIGDPGLPFLEEGRSYCTLWFYISKLNTSKHECPILTHMLVKGSWTGLESANTPLFVYLGHNISAKYKPFMQFFKNLPNFKNFHWLFRVYTKPYIWKHNIDPSKTYLCILNFTALKKFFLKFL